ncbi:MAG: sulfatase-like hydrolase/transferase [Colwellia sp.]|nr:sulfatase-like hydrolase/transferase [Colwellia sp.]MCW9079924.1 sulfatase-like hydrolase/transferase [Colwellia sp.]
MFKSNTLKTAALSVCSVILFACNSDKNNTETNHSSPVKQETPNIIMIIADDMGYADLSAAKLAGDVSTPNLDKLASSGIRFTQSYVTSPVCNTSRMGLLTGSYPQRQGGYFYGLNEMSPEFTTIAEMLKTVGYHTGYVGKYHYSSNSPESRDFPINHGFDSFYGFAGGRKHFLIHDDAKQQQHLADKKKYNRKTGQSLRMDSMWSNKEKVSATGITTELFGAKAREFISDNKHNKFYLQLAFNAVHNFTHQLPKEYLKEKGLSGIEDWQPEKESYYQWYQKGRYPNNPNGRAYYLGQLEYMDREIGKVLDTIKAQGLEEKTLVLFISDNGGSTPIYANNGHLRGSKYTLDEGGIRIPMLAAWPGVIAANQVIDNTISTMDIMPTLGSFAGAEKPKNINGIDISELLLGTDKTLNHPTLIWDTHYEYAVRDNNWKLKQVNSNEHAKFEMVELKLGTQLFDLSTDPAEAKNIAKDHPEIVKRLKALHQQWRTTMAEPKGV